MGGGGSWWADGNLYRNRCEKYIYATDSGVWRQTDRDNQLDKCSTWLKIHPSGKLWTNGSTVSYRKKKEGLLLKRILIAPKLMAHSVSG